MTDRSPLFPQSDRDWKSVGRDRKIFCRVCLVDFLLLAPLAGLTLAAAGVA